MRNKIALTLIVFSVLFSSCKKETPQSQNNEFIPGGIFIINEGNYSSANASITYFDPDEDSIINDVFYRANGVPLGDVAQNICIYKDNAFITVNNSGVVYAVNKFNMKYKGIISGLTSPRKTLIINDHKGYITDFSSKSIIIFNPQNFEITGTIKIGRTTEDILKQEDKVFVTNWSGYNQTAPNNMILVIDSNTDKVIDSITVGIEPQSIVLDKNSNLWVLCSGGYDHIEHPSLWCLNTDDFSIIKKLDFDNQESSPEDLIINKAGDKLFFINKDVYSMEVSSMTIPSAPFIKSNENTYYSILITANSEIYLSDVKDYVHNGEVYHFNSSGTLINSFEVGLIPGSMIEIE